MRERDITFKEALDDLIRADTASPFTTATAALRTPTVNLDHALRLASEIEDEELLRKMRAGK
jgi:hypothetical protein